MPTASDAATARPREKPYVTVAVCASVLVMMSWKLVQWRARKRARNSVRQVVESMKQNGPLMNHQDAVLYERIVATAMRRAAKWMNLSSSDRVHPLVGQVGGTGGNRKPMLTWPPDYILKPLIQDHRGIREIAFYEAMRISSPTAYSAFLTVRPRTPSTATHKPRPTTMVSYLRTTVTSTITTAQMYVDTLAMALAIWLQDPVVLQSERALRDAWQCIEREMEVLRQLPKFTAPYYGVLQHPPSLDGAHLLLQDLTFNYSRPCVMDLKMGVQTYEPDASPDKRAREFGKYPQQTQFGFRIVGMRYYDPKHSQGYRYYEKSYGRSLTTMAQLMESFRLFFSAGCTDGTHPQSDTNNDAIPVESSEAETTVLQNNESLANHRSNGHACSPSKRCQSSSNGMIRRRTVSNFLIQLRPLRRWFEENQSVRFYASSLLLIYEGDVYNSPNPDMVTVKMIDFGRVRREAGGDPGYITGLSTVRTIFEELLKDDEKRAVTQCC